MIPQMCSSIKYVMEAGYFTVKRYKLLSKMTSVNKISKIQSRCNNYKSAHTSFSALCSISKQHIHRH